MQIFKVTMPQIVNALDLCKELETHLGINLSNKNPDVPNTVHGYVNTDGKNDVEVCLYEDADVLALTNFPQEILIEDNGKVLSKRLKHAKSKFDYHGKPVKELYNQLTQKLVINNGGIPHEDCNKTFKREPHSWCHLIKQLDKRGDRHYLKI